VDAHESSIGDVAFFPDGERIVTVGGKHNRPGEVTLWHADTGREVMTLGGYPEAAQKVAFHTQTHGLVTMDATGRVHVVETGGPSQVVRSERAGATLYQRLAGLPVDGGPPLLKAELAAAIRTEAAVNEEVRQRALRLARGHQDDPERLAAWSWQVVSSNSETFEQYRSAVRLAETAAQLEPGNPRYLLALAMGQFRLKHYTSAFETLERAQSALHAQAAFLSLRLLVQLKSGLAKPAIRTSQELAAVAQTQQVLNWVAQVFRTETSRGPNAE
jgi:hypothetical protein